MLTPNETHILVGVLALAATDASADLELGSALLDHASGTKRDVDVTVRYRAPEGARIVAGLEVKAHTRPLDIEHVEQLAIKLSDVRLPEMKAIVSASGFTAAAIAKARAHGIELLSLCRWSEELTGIDTPFRGTKPPLLSEIYWQTGPHTHLELENFEEPPGGVNLATAEVLVTRADGSIARRPVGLLTNHAQEAAEKDARTNFVPFIAPGTQQTEVAYRCNIKNLVWLLHEDRRWLVERVLVSGVLAETATDGAESLRFLIRHEPRELLASCCVSEMRDGRLQVFAFDQRSRQMLTHVVSVEDREQKKIISVPLQRQSYHRVTLIQHPRTTPIQSLETIIQGPK